MAYQPAFSMIPGYDAIYTLRDRYKMMNDYKKNVGRNIPYASRRPDFGSVATAYNQIAGSVDMYTRMLPFGKNR